MTSITHRLKRGLKELRRTLGKPLSHALTAGAISLIILNLIKTCTGELLPVDGDQTARLTCQALEELKVSCEELIMPEKLHAFIQAYLALFVPDLAEYLERHHITLQQLANTLFYAILNCQSEECLGYQLNNLASCYSTADQCPTFEL